MRGEKRKCKERWRGDEIWRGRVKKGKSGRSEEKARKKKGELIKGEKEKRRGEGRQNDFFFFFNTPSVSSVSLLQERSLF